MDVAVNLFTPFSLSRKRRAKSGPLPREKLRVRCYAGLMSVDGAAPTMAFAIVYATTRQATTDAFVAFPLLLSALAIITSVYCRVYTVEALAARSQGAGRACVAAALAYLIAPGIGAYVSGVPMPARHSVVDAFVLNLILTVGARVVFNLMGMRLFTNGLISYAVLLDAVVQDGVSGHDFGAYGTVIEARAFQLEPADDDPIMLDRIGRAVSIFDRILVVCPPERRGAWARALKGSGVRAELVMPEIDELGPLGIGRMGSVSTVMVADGMLALRERALKRALDLAIALPALLFLLPLFGLVVVLIKLEDRGPGFFVQSRVGKGNKLFSVYKFRSMKIHRIDQNASQLVQRDDDRVTRVGRFLRKTSIDELPQLINVVLGNMSLVGPRPHATGATAGQTLYWEVDERYFHRHAAKPGLTGLAQVRGFRGNTENPDDLVNRLQADFEYLSGWNVWRDISILFRTIRVVVHSNAY